MEIYSEAVVLIGLLQDEWWSVSQPITVQATHPSLSTSDRKLASCLQTTPHAYIGHYGSNKTVFSVGANLHWLSWTIHLCCQSLSTFTTHFCCDISSLERRESWAKPSNDHVARQNFVISLNLIDARSWVQITWWLRARRPVSVFRTIFISIFLTQMINMIVKTKLQASLNHDSAVDLMKMVFCVRPLIYSKQSCLEWNRGAIINTFTTFSTRLLDAGGWSSV